MTFIGILSQSELTPLHHYNATATQQKYPVNITASTNGATPIDLSTNTPEFCVGQNVTFTLNGLPVGYIGSVAGNWQLPGKFVNWQTNYSGTCTTYVRNDGLLQNTPQTSCWFVNGNGGTVGVGLNLRFSNGQYANVAAIGNISIYRPTLSDFTNNSPTVTNAFAWLNGNTLSYGDPNENTDGIDWQVRINAKYDGRMGISQVFKAHYWVSPTLLPDPINTLNNPAADAGEFYNIGDAGIYAADGTANYYSRYTNSPGVQSIEFEDYPNLTFPLLALWGGIRFADSADYVRFKPGMGYGDGNIYVTLCVIHWQADGKYELSTFIPAFETNSTPPASQPDDSDDFPVWDSIRHTKGN